MVSIQLSNPQFAVNLYVKCKYKSCPPICVFMPGFFPVKVSVLLMEENGYGLYTGT